MTAASTGSDARREEREPWNYFTVPEMLIGQQKGATPEKIGQPEELLEEGLLFTAGGGLAVSALGRKLFAPEEISVDIITAIIGGPCFIILPKRKPA